MWKQISQFVDLKEFLTSEKVRLSELKQEIWLGESLNACECDWKLWTDKKKRHVEFQAAQLESRWLYEEKLWVKKSVMLKCGLTQMVAFQDAHADTLRVYPNEC